MNATLILTVGLLLAAPASYFGLHAFSEPASEAAPPALAATTVQTSVAEVPPTGTLRLRVHHDGADLAARVGLAVAGAQPEMSDWMLVEGENVVDHIVDTAASYTVSIAAEEDGGGLPLGFFRNSFSGSGDVSFEGCDAVEFLIQTVATDSTTGVSVLGARCMPGPMRFVSVERSGPRVSLPWPTCPLDCSMTYGIGRDEGRLTFEVPEGASRIDIIAHWSASSPMTRELEVMLLTPDAACGEGCWQGVAGAVGSEKASFTYEAPAPGEYAVWTSFTTPVGASIHQDVWLEAVVHL